MSDVSQGEGWWQASDGKWYPPTQPVSEPAAAAPTMGADPGAAGAQPPGPGYWMASDGQWYPPQQGAAPAVAPGYVPGYVNAANMDPLAKSKMTAGLLGIFLGGFGVHNFYLGNTNRGIIQIVLLIPTCGMSSIWGLIEGILILTGNESYRTDAEGRPLKD